MPTDAVRRYRHRRTSAPSFCASCPCAFPPWRAPPSRRSAHHAARLSPDNRRRRDLAIIMPAPTTTIPPMAPCRASCPCLAWPDDVLHQAFLLGWVARVCSMRCISACPGQCLFALGSGRVWLARWRDCRQLRRRSFRWCASSAKAGEKVRESGSQHAGYRRRNSSRFMIQFSTCRYA